MQSIPTAVRIVPLAGVANFRDLGGYRTADGATLRWNRLYRSGTLHALTDEDLAWLHSVDIRSVHDFRSNSERLRQPSRLAGVPGIDYWCRDHEQAAGVFRRMAQQADANPGHTRALMLRVYQELPHDFREAYRELFLRLADGRVPLVFNCSAGKDRAGVAAALVLSALGVPRQTVLEDYLLTEHCFERSCQVMLEGRADPFLRGIARDLWEPLMRADASYLDAMFDGLRAAHGSTENYLRDALGADGTVIARMRAHLLLDA